MGNFGPRWHRVIEQRIQMVDGDLVITIPNEEIVRLGLREGQTIGVEIVLVERRPVLRPELQAALEESWEQNEPAYRYLADR